MSIEITTGTAQGGRYDQEDRYLVHSSPCGILFAVMDGHGESEVAQISADYLGTFWDLAVREMDGYAEALRAVVHELDTITSEYQTQGSTLSLVFMPKATIEGAESTIHVAILGDSPVIANSFPGAIHVSPCHNVRNNLVERQAAEERGGVYASGYICTSIAGPGLQMSRALGDGVMGRVISKEPEIYELTIANFVLLATDGVIDPGHQYEHNELEMVVAQIVAGTNAQHLADRGAMLTGDNATAILIRRTKESTNEQGS